MVDAIFAVSLVGGLFIAVARVTYSVAHRAGRREGFHARDLYVGYLEGAVRGAWAEVHRDGSRWSGFTLAEAIERRTASREIRAYVRGAEEARRAMGGGGA